MSHLSVSGYPRSGNTFLGYFAWISYYPNQERKQSWHTVRAMKEQDYVLVPFRNPIEAITSFYIYSGKKESIKNLDSYYRRMYTNALDFSDKVLLVDFDFFTKDTNYLYESIKDRWKIEPLDLASSLEIKIKMDLDGKRTHLPRDNYEEKENVRKYLLDNWDFSESLNLYNKLKER
jgi:hypothetical protein